MSSLGQIVHAGDSVEMLMSLVKSSQVISHWQSGRPSPSHTYAGQRTQNGGGSSEQPGRRPPVLVRDSDRALHGPPASQGPRLMVLSLSFFLRLGVSQAAGDSE